MSQRLNEAAQAIRQHIENSENADAIRSITRMFADLLTEAETLRARVAVSEFTGDQDSLGRVMQQAKFVIESCDQENAIATVQAMLTEALKKVAEQGRELSVIRTFLADPEHGDLPESVCEAVAKTLGDSYDCMRVWNAWGVGTMSEDDFVSLAQAPVRLNEIARAAIVSWQRCKRAETAFNLACSQLCSVMQASNTACEKVQIAFNGFPSHHPV